MQWSGKYGSPSLQRACKPLQDPCSYQYYNIIIVNYCLILQVLDKVSWYLPSNQSIGAIKHDHRYEQLSKRDTD